MKLLKLLFLVFFPAILSAQESCRIWDGTDFMGVNADGSLNVTANAGTNLNTSALATSALQSDTRVQGMLAEGMLYGSARPVLIGGVDYSSSTVAFLDVDETSGALVCNIGSSGGIATAASQTSGAQKTQISNGSVEAQVEAAATYSLKLTDAAKGLDVNARAHQLWAADHPDTGAGADNGWYAQNMDDNGNLSINLSAIRGTPIPMHDAADTNAPIKVGSKGTAAEPTPVTEADRVQFWADLSGRQVVRPSGLTKGSSAVVDVDNDATAIKVVDGTTAGTSAVIVTNCGVDVIYLWWADTASTTLFFRKLVAGEAWEYPLGTNASSDVYANRATDQTDDDVCVSYMAEQ